MQAGSLRYLIPRQAERSSYNIDSEGLMSADNHKHNQSSSFRSRSAFAITETELRLMAAPAMIGLSRMPNHG